MPGRVIFPQEYLACVSPKKADSCSFVKEVRQKKRARDLRIFAKMAIVVDYGI